MEPKDVTAGRYERLEQIGASERAVLFHAYDHQKHQKVVVKRFDPARLPAGALDRYAATIALLKRSDLPGAMLPLEVVSAGAAPFAVFRPLVGESAAHLITRAGPVSWQQAAGVVARCAAVLAATLASTGLSHRALKPSNIWLSPTGEVTILDLGIAELGVHAEPPRPGPVFVEYRAPEQIDGAAGDPRSDVFALGVMLYELVTGVHPFAGPSAFHVVRQLLLSNSPLMPALTRGMSPSGAREAEKLLGCALARDPAERFSGPQDFLQALEFARRAIGAPARPARAVEPPSPAPAPERTVLVVEDPTTILQPPGLGTQRRASGSPAQVPAVSPSPAISLSEPAASGHAISAAQPGAPRSRPLQPLPGVDVALASNPVARFTSQTHDFVPVQQTVALRASTPVDRMSMGTEQPYEPTEVLPSNPSPQAPEWPTERDVVPVRASSGVAQDGARAIALAVSDGPPRAVVSDATLVWPGRAGLADEAPTAAHPIDIAPTRIGRMSAAGPVVEATLLLPSDHTGGGARPAELHEPSRAERPLETTPTMSSGHKILIALNLLCLVLVVCGLLASGML